VVSSNGKEKERADRTGKKRTHMFLVHVEVDAAVLDQAIVFDKRFGIQQHFQAFASCELASGVLSFDTLLATSQGSLLLDRLQLVGEDLEKERDR
jgi:hypothetical protein